MTEFKNIQTLSPPLVLRHFFTKLGIIAAELPIPTGTLFITQYQSQNEIMSNEKVRVYKNNLNNLCV